MHWSLTSRIRESAIFTQYPQFISQHHLVQFMCDTFRLVVLGGVPPHDMEALMDGDIETHHHEGTKPGMILQKSGTPCRGWASWLRCSAS